MVDPDRLRRGLKEIDFVLHRAWRLGRTIVAGWLYREGVLSFCMAEPYRVLGQSATLPRLVTGRRQMGPRTFNDACKILRARPIDIQALFEVGADRDQVSPGVIENLVRRYAITQTRQRAVILFDIVGFSKVSAIEQVAMLSSLEYSINSAGKKMNDAGMRVELARSTVGDGFYVWNRSKGYDADMRSYVALMLILADNALARDHGAPNLVPTLRTCFCIGPHFSYHQVEGTVPRGFEYIVGDVTITLARLIAKAGAGQLLVGNFIRPTHSVQTGDLDPPGFLARADKLAQAFAEDVLGGAKLVKIRSSLTAMAGNDGRPVPAVFSIPDKHGFRHEAYNARLFFERDGADPIRIGADIKAMPEFAAFIKPL